MAGVGWQAGGSADAGHAGGLARAQYAALLKMRWRLVVSGLRSIHGILDLGATGIALMIYTFMGVGLGVGMSVATYMLASRAQWQFVPFLFWALLVIWQIMPIVMASFQEQFDLGILLRFPVRFETFFALYLVFGITDASTIQGALCCIGVWMGIAMTRPDLLLWATSALIVFAVFNTMLARAIFVWIDRWLAQRRTREILGAGFLVLVLSLQLLNPAAGVVKYQSPNSRQAQAVRQERQTKFGPWIDKVNALQGWLPPGLAARTITDGAQNHTLAGLGALGLLGLYALAAGGVLAVRLKAEYRGENLSFAPSRVPAAPRGAAKVQSREAIRGAGLGSGPVPGMIEKEVHALLRTLPYLYAIVAPLLMMLVFSGVFLHSHGPDVKVFPLALPICLVYSQLGFTQLLYNNLGAEGVGIQLYFLSPTPFRTVMLAKNLLHSALFFLVAIAAGFLAVWRLGTPDASIVAASIGWMIFALPLNLSAGNIFSIRMAYRVNPGRISRQPGSQANALLSLLIQLGILLLSAAVFLPCYFLNRSWLAAPIFLVLSVGSVLVWLRILRNMDTMANDYKEALIETLAKTG